MLKADNGTVQLTLKDKNDAYQFVDAEVDEICSLPILSFHDITIVSSGNVGDIYVDIHLNERAARIYVSQDNVKDRVIIEKCKAILRPRNKVIAFALFGPTLPMLSSVYAGSTFRWHNYAYTIAIVGFSLVWLLARTHLFFRNSSTFYIKPRQRHEMPSFFIRRRDKLLLAAISGLFGAFMGALLIREGKDVNSRRS